MTESQKLLEEFAEHGSESAFRELVTRYVDFVYSAAARMAWSAPHLAEDITQIVFTDLARKSASLSREVMLVRWLHRHTCYVAANLLRSERRRQARERRAVEMNTQPDHSAENLAKISPLLDDAINHLSAADRTAILLRYFQQRDLRAVGQALGTNEDAARKRISRALEKLQILLARRGVAMPAAGVGAALAAGTLQAAPAGLTATIGTSALAGATATSSTLFTILNMMTRTKLGVAGGLIIASVAATFLVHQNAEARLQQDEALLSNQAADLAQLKSPPTPTPVPAGPDLNTPAELTRMRNEISALQQQTNDLADLQIRLADARKKYVRRSALGSLALSHLQDQAEMTSKMNYSKRLLITFTLYAQANQGQYPDQFAKVANYIDTGLASQTNLSTNQFEIVFQGTLAQATNPPRTVLFRETTPVFYNGNFTRVYGFVDGHVEIANTPDGDFDQWEADHSIITAP